MSAITAGAASALRISRQGALYRLNSRKCNTTLRQQLFVSYFSIRELYGERREYLFCAQHIHCVCVREGSAPTRLCWYA
jgi:hypothetical protein